MAAIRGSIEGADCANCPLAKDGVAENPVFGAGSSNPRWIIIGEGPGNTEVKLGAPFVGESGKHVGVACARVGVKRADIWIDNATLCKPGPGQDDKVRHEAAEACKGRLQKQLAQFPGKPVLALGAVATKILITTKLTKITDLASTHHRSDFDGTGERSVIPSVHPAAIMRGAGKNNQVGAKGSGTAIWNLWFDVAKVEAMARGLDVVFGEDVLYESGDPTRACQLVEDMLKEIREEGFCGCDLETFVEDPARHSAKWPFAAKIKTIGLGTDKRAISAYWHLFTPDVIQQIRDVLADESITKIFHNRIYDVGVFIANGFSVKGNIEDTLLGHHVAFPGAPHKLQGVTAQFWATPPWKAEFRDGKETPEETVKYNALDTLATGRLKFVLEPHIKKRGLEKLYAMDRRAAEIACRMHLRGIPISREANRDLAQKFLVIINDAKDRLEAKAEELHGEIVESLALERAVTKRKADPDGLEERFNVRVADIKKEIAKGKWKWSSSNTGHIIALLKAQNVALYAKTKSGKTSTKADVLEGLSHIPEVADILQYRGHQNVYTGSVLRMFDWLPDAQGKLRAPWVQEDGRIHPTWSVHKISGRWGATDPAVMNWTKGNEKAKNPMHRTPNIRRQIVAPEGRIFIGFDFAQLEARIMALLSEDPFLVKIFVEDRDIHIEFGRILFPAIDQLDPMERKRARDVTKRFEYGALYGGDDDTVWKSIVVDYPEYTVSKVSQAIKKMKEKVKVFLQWQQKTYINACKPPYEIYSYILKRARCFPLGAPPKTEINNQPMQSTAADIMNIGLDRLVSRLDSEFKEAFPILQVHDSIVVEADEDDGYKIKQVVEETMTQEYSGILFPVDVAIGKSVADL